jgi:hypothetical protein
MGERIKVQAQATSGNTNLFLYESKRPVKSVAGESIEQLERVKAENVRLAKTVRDLEKKIARIVASGASTYQATHESNEESEVQ